MNKQKKATIYLNGDLESYKNFDFPKNSRLTVSADGAYNFLSQKNIKIDFIIGDFDSIDQELLSKIKKSTPEKLIHKESQYLSDFEKTVDFLIQKEVKEITVFGALGKRKDHELINLHLPFNEKYHDINFSFVSPSELLIPLVGSSNFRMDKHHVGKTFSLLPISESVEIIKLSGAKWELRDEILTHGSPLGLSNIVTSEEFEITVGVGKVFLIVNY